ncbi:MAG: hypothetical protein WD960_16245 [Gemmatimonadota bacterium]
MTGRLARTLRRAELDEGVASAVMEVLAAALGHREALLQDPHDHRLLHPARSVLVLLEDAEVREGELLAAVAAHDSRFPGLALRKPPWPGAVPGDPEGVIRELPLPCWVLNTPEPSPPSAVRADLSAEASPPDGLADERLLEALVALSDPLLTVALCEALDHLRHLHVEEGRPQLERGIELARSVYLPASSRMGGVLERRFRWWHDTLGRAV